MKERKFYLSSEFIRADVAPGRGACMASDLITVNGMKVGYMYREKPDFETDSGWHFFAGTETQEYAEHADNFAIYDVNTIANYDTEIIPFLDSPAGSAFERDRQTGYFQSIPFPDNPDDP